MTSINGISSLTLPSFFTQAQLLGRMGVHGSGGCGMPTLRAGTPCARATAPYHTRHTPQARAARLLLAKYLLFLL